MPEAELSKSVEDFLKAVYVLQQRMERASTNALADALKISPPSVTDMARRLVSAGLVDYQRYYGVVLTDDGQDVALRIIRRHRLIELYLVEELGYELHQVHEEADNLEHAVSDHFIEAIARKLNNPTTDPHGDPIPTKEGRVIRRPMVPLSELPLDTPARVSRFASENTEMLQHILNRGFKLDEEVKVISRDPFDGPIVTKVQEEERVIGHQVATFILVEPMLGG